MIGRRLALDRTRSVVALAVALGLGLRLAAARGGLWLDEAWSAIYAARARTPLGVFTAINHDNNHHLNSLWLQTIGLAAPPLLARLPSILAGTAAIVVAAAIGARRSAPAAMIAALLFATSPILVDLGAEARGYATMTLALLGLLLVLDRWLGDPAAPPPRLAIAALAAFGMVSQLTMVFGIVALGGWVFVRLIVAGWRFRAIERSFDALWPAIAAALIMFAIVFGAAAASSTGLQVGSYESFTVAKELWALHELTLDTIGLSLASAAATVIVALLGVIAMTLARDVRMTVAFYLLAIVGLPAIIALLAVPNTHYSRYYMVSAVAALLLVAEWTGRRIAARALAGKMIAAAIVAVLLAASVARDAKMIANDRAHPAAPIGVMRGAAPQGTIVLLDNERSSAVLRVAADAVGYPLVVRQRCPAAAFLLLDNTDHRRFPAATDRCGANYRLVDAAYVGDLPGMDWALYQRATGKN